MTKGIVRRYKILYRTFPAWEVGAGTPDVIRDSHYPDDYAGIVISIVAEGHRFSPGDLADPRRREATLDLTGGEIARLRTRQLKVVGTHSLARTEPVTLEDRWGEAAVGLRARFGSLAEELERQAADCEDDDHPFNVQLRRAMRELPAMLTHSGAGLYEVGSGKTYSTIQSALDQLWTDQGTAKFTASQYIRIFAGTYDENVVPNLSLQADAVAGFPLILEGDPADSRNNIILAPTSGARAIYTQVVCTLIRHMTIDGTAGITSHTLNNGRGGGGSVYNDAYTEVDDCVLSATTDRHVCYTANIGNHWTLIDCVLSTGGSGVVISSNGYYTGTCRIEGCRISRTGSKGGRGIWAVKNMDVYACVIEGFNEGVYADGWREAQVPSGIRNNTFYDCTYAMHLRGGIRGADIINNAVDACDYAIGVSSWPDEASGTFGGPFTLRNNCLHYTTAFAYDGSDTKTYAQFIALDRVDASGNLDATDPKLADPAGGDFSLAADSPCWRRGMGSGVIKDYLGIAFDKHFPDIGAWSSLGSATSGSYDVVRSVLDVTLAAYESTNVAWENKEYTPTIGTPYLRPIFLPAEPEQAELGTRGRNRLLGIYQISIFAPTGKGAGEAEGIAEDLVAYFKQGKSFTSGDVTVRVSRAWRSVAVQEKDWFHVPVTIRWFAYVAN